MTDKLRSPALDPMTLPARTGSSYPAPYDADCADREKRALGDALGLTRYGVNLVRLAPGCWSAQRHWHAQEDEFVYILEGTATLVTDGGEQTLGPGMVAGFPGGREDGHHLINKSDATLVYLEVGDRPAADDCHYPDIDLHIEDGKGRHPGIFTNKKGEPY